MQEIEIRITSEGKVIIGTSGFEGTDCLKITEALEKALGDVETRTYTSEYYRENQLGNQPTIGIS